MIRRILKIGAWTVGGFAALALLALAAIYTLSEMRLHRHYTVTVQSLNIASDEQSLTHGRHVATIRGCFECHGADLAGKPVIDDPLVGHLHAPNLTLGRGGRGADFSNDDFVRAIRHGVSQTGRPYLLMPSHEFATLSDEDTAAVIALIKSLPPVDKPRGPVSAGPLARLLVLLGQIEISAEIIDHDVTQVDAVPAGPTVEYGRYLATSCLGCHGSSYAGGPIAGAPPDWPAAANLTPHADSRLSRWSENEFIQTLRTAQRPDGTELHPVMPRVYREMSDDELKAVYRFLRTLPPVTTGKSDS